MITVTVQTRYLAAAEGPHVAPAMEAERDTWGVFGTCGDSTFDGTTITTEVTVASEHGLQALQGAVERRAVSEVTHGPQAAAAAQTTAEGR